jgi:4-carboxymuconolactone decarboxylase
MPEMAQRLEVLRTYLRKDDSLSQKLQEMVMLTVAREMNCAFIWYAHAAAARQAGVRDEIVDSIKERRPLSGLAPEEQIAASFARELLQKSQSEQAHF